MTPWKLRARAHAALAALLQAPPSPAGDAHPDDSEPEILAARLHAFHDAWCQFLATAPSAFDAARALAHMHDLAIEMGAFDTHTDALPSVAAGVWSTTPALRQVLLSEADLLATLIAQWAAHGFVVPNEYGVGVAMWAENLRTRVPAVGAALPHVEHGPHGGFMLEPLTLSYADAMPSVPPLHALPPAADYDPPDGEAP